MSGKRITIVLGAALLVLLVAGFATAHGPKGGSWWGGHQMMGGSGWGHGQMMGETSGDYAPCARWGGESNALPAEKREAAEKLYREHREKAQGIQEQLYAKQTQLRGLLADPKADAKQVKALTGDINTLRSDLFTEQVAFKQAFAKETGISFQQPQGRGGMRQGFAQNRGGRGCQGW